MARRKAETALIPRPEETSHSPLSATIHQWLQSSIISGAFAPGHVLRQEELAARFNTSRVPLRDALQHLQADGLVMLRPRRGYAVTSLDTTQLLEVMQLRMLIEGHAGFAATLVRTDRDVRNLESCLKDMDKMPLKAGTEAQRLRWSVLNRRFHDTLFAAGGRSHLQKISTNLSAKVEPYILMEISMTHELAEAQADHHQIFAAYKAGDADEVSILSRRHCERTAIRFVEVLQNKGLVPDLKPSEITNLGAAVAIVEQPRSIQARAASKPAATGERLRPVAGGTRTATRAKAGEMTG